MVRGRLIMFLVVMSLVATACSGSGEDVQNKEAPACVVNATALAKLAQGDVKLRINDGGRIKNGSVPPDFALCDENGEIVQLSSYEGKPVLLVFWASWCGFCAKELPTIDAILDDIPDDLVVITVATLEESGVSWDYHVAEGFRFTTAFDTSGTVAQDYGIRGVPRAIFINADGTVAGQIIGEAHFDKPKCFEQIQRFGRGETSTIVTAYCRR